MESFVYCWTDHLTNKLYVGSHKGSTDDGYVCSSKYMMEEYNKRPQDFTRQILAEGDYDDIRKFESKILQAVNAKMNEQFYNRHNNCGDYYRGKGYTITEEHKKKVSAAKKGKKRPDLAERNRLVKSQEMKKWRAENPIVWSEETKQRMSESAKKRANSEEGRQALTRASHSRKPRTPEQNRQHSEAMKRFHARKKEGVFC